jgi:hypothetical protein
MVPAGQGPFALSFPLPFTTKRGAALAPGSPEPIRLYLAGNPRPLAALPGVGGGDGRDDARPVGLPVDLRWHLFADARLLVHIPAAADRLVLYPFDLDKALEATGTDYLEVVSLPPPARRGGAFDYTLSVKAKRGGVTCRLESGPAGMAVTPGGRVTWAVLPDWPEEETSAVIRVRDAAGRELLHTLTILTQEPSPTGSLAAVGPSAPLESRELPGPVADVAAGGGGRYLVLHLATLRKLAVFDAEEGRVAHYVSLPEDRALFAAGQDQLVVLLPESRQLLRYDLATGRLDLTAPLPVTGRPVAAHMGAASRGPLVIHWTGTPQPPETFALRAFDPTTLRPWGATRQPPRAVPVTEPAHYRASADGHTLGYWPGSGRLFGMFPIGDPEKGCAVMRNALYAVPGPDGRTLFTSDGLYTTQGRPLGESRAGGEPLCVPAYQGPFYLAAADNMTQNHPGYARPDGTCRMAVYLPDSPRPLARWDGLPAVIPAPGTPNDLTPDKCFHLIPSAKRIVLVAPSRDRLLVTRFDPTETLERSGADYLIVTSQPPAEARRGEVFRYAIRAQSRKGGVRFQVVSGPNGMAVGPDGVVTWPVPAEAPAEEVTAILSLSDSSGRETFHTLHLAVTDGAPPPGPPAAPAPRVAAPVPPRPAPDVRPLPAVVEDVVVGGGGRYLILALSRARQLAVFDVREGKVVRYLPVQADDVRLAAGRDALVVANPAANTLERWSLATFAKETAAPVPGGGRVSGLWMGADSHGPLLLSLSGAPNAEGDKGLFLDPGTLQPLSLSWKEGGLTPIAPNSVRVSADGAVFHVSYSSRAVPTVNMVVVRGGVARHRAYPSYSGGLLIPDHTGRYFYAADGAYDASLARVPLSRPPGLGFWRPLVPAYGGSLALELEFGQPGAHGALTVLAEGGRPLIRLADVDGLSTSEVGRLYNERIAYDRRVHFFPEAKCLVTIPASNDRLVVHRLDLDAELERSGTDFLYVASVPPDLARRGTTYAYEMAVRAKRGSVAFRMASGPKGMAVSPTGRVTWAVPADWQQENNSVNVIARDAVGQEVTQSFTVRVAELGGDFGGRDFGTPIRPPALLVPRPAGPGTPVSPPRP